MINKIFATVYLVYMGYKSFWNPEENVWDVGFCSIAVVLFATLAIRDQIIKEIHEHEQ